MFSSVSSQTIIISSSLYIQCISAIYLKTPKNTSTPSKVWHSAMANCGSVAVEIIYFLPVHKLRFATNGALTLPCICLDYKTPWLPMPSLLLFTSLYCIQFLTICMTQILDVVNLFWQLTILTSSVGELWHAETKRHTVNIIMYKQCCLF